MSVAPALIGPGRLILVVGPSGAGKDTVLAGTKVMCESDSGIVFARRAVTRPSSSAEDHDTLTNEAFERAVADNAFAFWWRAHDLAYGIWRSAEDDVRGGRTVVCNVSRTIIENLRGRYARVDSVLITAPVDVLSARLAGRARESSDGVTERLQRNDAFAAFRADHLIDNSGAPEEAVRRLLDIIQFTAAMPD